MLFNTIAATAMLLGAVEASYGKYNHDYGYGHGSGENSGHGSGSSSSYINYTSVAGYFLQDEPSTNASTFSYVSAAVHAIFETSCNANADNWWCSPTQTSA